MDNTTLPSVWVCLPTQNILCKCDLSYLISVMEHNIFSVYLSVSVYLINSSLHRSPHLVTQLPIHAHLGTLDFLVVLNNAAARGSHMRLSVL